MAAKKISEEVQQMYRKKDQPEVTSAGGKAPPVQKRQPRTVVTGVGRQPPAKIKKQPGVVTSGKRSKAKASR